jgi:hypothetical protein
MEPSPLLAPPSRACSCMTFYGARSSAAEGKSKPKTSSFSVAFLQRTASSFSSSVSAPSLSSAPASVGAKPTAPPWMQMPMSVGTPTPRHTEATTPLARRSGCASAPYPRSLLEHSEPATNPVPRMDAACLGHESQKSPPSSSAWHCPEP